MRELQVSAGAGLVSVIAESRSAQWVQNYSDYTALRHDDAVDAAIVAEGLVSILGVPMLSDGQILGVRFAADRRERRFTADQIALLSALADHASVVLQTARASRVGTAEKYVGPYSRIAVVTDQRRSGAGSSTERRGRSRRGS